MAVDFVDIPAESTKALAEIIRRKDFTRIAQRLLTVEIDDRGEIRQPVVRGKHRRLPDGTFIAFRVAQQRERPAVRFLQSRRPCRARRKSQTHPEASSAEVHAGQQSLRMDAKRRIVAAEFIKLSLIDPTE